MELVGDVLPFLEGNDIGVATRGKMLDILNSAEKRVLLELEVAATVNGGLPFVQATYTLEGDGPMVLNCFQSGHSGSKFSQSQQNCSKASTRKS